jgi:hypothetical protein
VAVEDHRQNGDQEQDFGGEHRLHHGEVAEAQGGGLQPEGDQQEGEAQHPDPPMERMGEQPKAHGVPGRGRLDPDALENPGDRAGQRG